MLNENDAALDLCLTQWAEDSAGELRSVLLAAQARLRELARGGECEPAGASGRIDDIELPIRPSVLGGPAVEAWENRKEDGHSQAEEQRRRIAKGLVVPSGVSVEELCRRLTAVSHCRRCECLDCSNGYENHSHYCTHGKNCVETPQRWSAWMFGVAKTTNEAATLIRRLERERERLQGVIERDRTKTAEIIGEIRGAVEPYRWIGEGRGSYSWDDERYQSEFSNCMAALYAALDPLRCLAADWSDCPKDFQGARIDWKARATTAEAEAESWKSQFHSAAEAASMYVEFYEQHHADFDPAGNYIPHSQIDGDLRAAKAEAERLRAVLKPFAAWWRDSPAPDDALCIIGGAMAECPLTWGDLRRARTALEGK